MTAANRRVEVFEVLKNSNYPSISADGQFVAFTSFAKNLIEGLVNICHEVFVYEMQTGTITIRPKPVSRLRPVTTATAKSPSTTTAPLLVATARACQVASVAMTSMTIPIPAVSRLKPQPGPWILQCKAIKLIRLASNAMVVAQRDQATVGTGLLA